MDARRPPTEARCRQLCAVARGLFAGLSASAIRPPASDHGLHTVGSAAVDVQRLTGDEARLVGYEKQHRVRDVLRLARAAGHCHLTSRFDMLLTIAILS